jgi:excinuclease ABC subunit C
VLQHIRNEAHRFGITFHRDKRSKKFIKSELDDITGIGPKTIEILLKNFNSVMRIRQSSYDELVGIIGQSKTKIIKEYFESN